MTYLATAKQAAEDYRCKEPVSSDPFDGFWRRREPVLPWAPAKLGVWVRGDPTGLRFLRQFISVGYPLEQIPYLAFQHLAQSRFRSLLCAKFDKVRGVTPLRWAKALNVKSRSAMRIFKVDLSIMSPPIAHYAGSHQISPEYFSALRRWCYLLLTSH
jgi:hypothetical protein